MNNDYYTPTRSQMRHDYAHCGYVYKQTATRRVRIAHGVAAVLVFALIAVLLAWRG